MTTPGGREHRAARWLTGGLAVWLLPVAILSASEPSAPSGSGIMPNTGVSIEDPLPVDTGSPDTKQAAPTQQPQGDPADKNDLTSAASSAGQADEGGQGDAVPHEPRMIPRGGSSVGGAHAPVDVGPVIHHACDACGNALVCHGARCVVHRTCDYGIGVLRRPPVVAVGSDAAQRHHVGRGDDEFVAQTQRIVDSPRTSVRDGRCFAGSNQPAL